MHNFQHNKDGNSIVNYHAVGSTLASDQPLQSLLMFVQGILSTSLTEPIWGSTTVKDSFPPPAPPSIRTTGNQSLMTAFKLLIICHVCREETGDVTTAAV